MHYVLDLVVAKKIIFFHFLTVPPSIDGEDETNVTVTFGGEVTLTCDAAGDPPPTIVWMKDGTPLIFTSNENFRLSFDNQVLTITGA